MSRLELLEREVQALSADELRDFERWLSEYKARLWDEQMEADSKAGKLKKLEEKAKESIKAGKWREL